MKNRILAFILCLAIVITNLICIDNNTLTAEAGNYSAKLLSTALAENENYSSRYSIETFPVDLFDYTPSTFNTALGTTGNHFKFVGYDTGVGSNGGVNDSTSTYAKQGIVQDTLKDGYPVFNHVKNGVNNAKAFFDPNYNVSGKTSYDDVDFEFIYDNVTGYYEYKSSANHAQYNSSTDTVRLYADSLSIYNAEHYEVPIRTDNTKSFNYLNAPSDAPATQTGPTIDEANNTLSAKAIWNGSRLDPNFMIDGLNINVASSAINKISVQVKVPTNVVKTASDSTQFKVYYQTQNASSAAETRMVSVSYKPTGNWQTIEIPIPAAKKEEWATEGTIITSLRIDPFDNHDSSDQTNTTVPNISGTTIDTSKTFDFSIRNIGLTSYSYSTYPSILGTGTNGGFYPFSDITESYASGDEPFSLENWQEMMESSSAMAYGTRSVGYPSPTSTEQTANLAYGTVMEFSFYIPVNGVGKDLTYYFNGDDDLWVFVDGKLVLDIGGGHGAIDGVINFTKGTSTVANAVEVSGYTTNKGNATEVTTTLDAALTAPGKHTMKVFYLERCGSVSNCHMKFNLPRTPEGNVEVSKTLALDNVDKTSSDSVIKSNTSFDYEIKLKGTLAGLDQTQNLYSGEYYVVDANGETATQNTTDGTFQLKNGEMAAFIIDEGYEVTVTEKTSPEIAGYDYVSTTVNGTSGLSATAITANATSRDFDFVNTYKEKSTTYNYIPVNPSDCPEDKKGTVELTGDTSTKTHENTGVSETVGVRVDNPSGSTAQGSNAVKFVGWYSDEACTQLVTAAEATINRNILDPVKVNDLYPGNTFYAKFEYMYGNLEIEKSGISDLDNHEEDNFHKEEAQTTIYSVKGTSNSGVKIDLEVAIVGNSSVIIKDIPVGTYTVKELENWSWRYDAVNDTQEAVITDTVTTTKNFVNNRNRTQWLSGDAYCDNTFGAMQ